MKFQETYLRNIPGTSDNDAYHFGATKIPYEYG